jgi:sugar phosphate isomerase/epimerase
VTHHLDVARKLGSPILRGVAGNLLSRDEGCDMAKLADDTVAILREACKAAEDWGIKIAMENHADFTVREWLSIRSRVNSPAMCFTMDTANLAFDLDDPIRLARMLAPFTAATHLKNYRILRTAAGLALENCSLGEGEIDQRAIAQIVAEQHPEVNLSIEIHTQYAPFRLDILDETFFTRHVPPPGDGLAWYLNKAWQKDVVESLPPDLPDGPETWNLEFENIKQSVQWARENLTHVLTK